MRFFTPISMFVKQDSGGEDVAVKRLRRFFKKNTYRYPGVIKLPFLGWIKQCKCREILRDFPYNSALFGLVT